MSPPAYLDLVWKVGDQTGHAGPSFSITPSVTGTLYLAMNDIEAWSDNRGAWTVVLDVTSPGEPDITYDCGSGPFTQTEALQLAVAAGLPDDQKAAFINDPCADMAAELVHTGQVIADDPAGSAPIAGSGPIVYAPCKIATNTFTLRTRLTRGWTVDTASFDMVTQFCYEGGVVFKRGGDGVPDAAAIQNVRILPFGSAYQANYTGSDDAGIVKGYATWNGRYNGAFFTSRQTTWSGTLPILNWVWSEFSSKTTTQVVYANGSHEGYFGTFGNPQSPPVP